jgi:hypothetical protein
MIVPKILIGISVIEITHCAITQNIIGAAGFATVLVLSAQILRGTWQKKP